MATEQTAQTARAEAGAVAGTVKEETKNVAQEAQQQASSALHQVQDDVRTRANEEATKFAQTLHDTSQQLQSMAGAAGGDGVASSLVREGANATERLASRLDQGGVEAVMADARARLRAAGRVRSCSARSTVGFLTGRLVRNLSGRSQPAPTDADNGHRAIPASTTWAARSTRRPEPTGDRYDAHRARSDETEGARQIARGPLRRSLARVLRIGTRPDRVGEVRDPDAGRQGQARRRRVRWRGRWPRTWH